MTVSCSATKPLVEESKSNTNSSQEASEGEQASQSSSENISTTQNLNIIPMEFTETLISEETPFPAKGVSQDHLFDKTAEPGWKYVNIRLAFENSSDNFIDIYSWESLSGIKLLTEQDWSYDLDMLKSIGKDAFLPFYQFEFKIDTDRFKIPGGFRIAGDNLFENFPRDKWCESYYLRFKVAEKSSGYTLIIPGYPDTKITNNLNSIVFPTTLPNSSFRAIGETLNIPEKGNLKILDFSRDPDSSMANLTSELFNASGGYNQEFNLGFIFVGDDGIFRCQEFIWERAGTEDVSLFRLALPGPITLGPEQTEILKANTYIPSNVKNIKLIITGDMNAVVNLD